MRVLSLEVALQARSGLVAVKSQTTLTKGLQRTGRVSIYRHLSVNFMIIFITA